MKRRGMITVEAALIMPVILGCIFLLYSLAMIQYGNVVTRAEAMRVANRVAINWNTIGGDGNTILTEDRKATVYKGEEITENMKTGAHAISSASYEEHDPYRFFLELFTTESQKKSNIQEYLNAQMSDLSDTQVILDFENTSVIENDKGYHIFNRYVEVTLTNVYNNPMIDLLDQLGFKQNKTYEVTVKAKLTEPAEFVRNVSFIQEYIREKNNTPKESDSE